MAKHIEITDRHRKGFTYYLESTGNEVLKVADDYIVFLDGNNDDLVIADLRVYEDELPPVRPLTQAQRSRFEARMFDTHIEFEERIGKLRPCRGDLLQMAVRDGENEKLLGSIRHSVNITATR